MRLEHFYFSELERFVNLKYKISGMIPSTMQWRAEGGADGATAPGIHHGGHPRGQFL